MKVYDIIIIGAGASGLWAARTALARGKTVAILEMKNSAARKVAISGGGNCNITNTDANYTRYFGKNPNFVRSALSALTPNDILEWARGHKLSLYEKTPGRFFCKNGASAVVDALMHDASGSDFFWDTNVQNVKKENDVFITETCHGIFKSKSVIVATGGTSFGTLGVSDIGFKVAKSFGHKIVPVRPALCAMSFKYFPTDFSGVSVVSEIKIGKQKIIDDLLFTHFGIGGPAAYRASVRDITDGLYINLAPDIDLRAMLNDAKHINGRKKLSTVLAEILPTRVAKWIAGDTDKNIADLNKDLINLIAEKTQNIFIPVHDIKYHNLQSAEVIRGGVDTENISSKTMESKLCSGLFFAGEVIDIAGDLGGFNLHWAWASGHTAGTYA